MKNNIYIENYIVVKVDLVYLLSVYGLFIFYMFVIFTIKYLELIIFFLNFIF